MNKRIHLGIIPDGNRRWCKSKGKEINYLINYWFKNVFLNEIKILKDIIYNENFDENYKDLSKIKEVSIYLITADNINKRQDVSTQIVFTLIEKLYHMIKNDLTTELSIFKYLKIDIIKSECLIPHNILLMIEEIKELTKFNKTMLLTVGIGYDPNKDLENIIQNGERDQTDIDLVFRSGGEKRLSGFFPFHTMHSELVFVDKLWPDIRLKDINDAVIEYERRDRRFGK
jgi:undecaprenyl diphosphate synthase